MEVDLPIDLDRLLGGSPDGMNQMVMLGDGCPTGKGKASWG